MERLFVANVECDLEHFMLGSGVAAATVVPAAMQCAKVKGIRTERLFVAPRRPQ